jgi:hypothetical protein
LRRRLRRRGILLAQEGKWSLDNKTTEDLDFVTRVSSDAVEQIVGRERRERVS